MTTGEKLRTWREKSGLTQDQAAKCIGATQATWKAWEHGSTPEADYIEAIEKLTHGAILFRHWARCRRRKRLAERDSSTNLTAAAHHKAAS